MASNTPSPGSSPENPRGIQNAGARFNEHAENRQLRTQLLRSAEQQRNTRAINRPRDTSSSYIETTQGGELQRSHREIQQIFEDAGQDFDETDMQDLLGMKRDEIEKPRFPYFIFTIALIKDIIDAIATITVVGIVVSLALSFLCALVLFLWTLSKLRGTGKAQKKLANRILLKYGLATGIEFIPGVNVIPTTTLFVLLTYFDEKKVGKMLSLAHKTLRR